MIQILGVESGEGKKSSAETQGHQESIVCPSSRALGLATFHTILVLLGPRRSNSLILVFCHNLAHFYRLSHHTVF